MYGRKPRCSSDEWASTTAIAKPNAAPSRKPAAASFAVKRAASRSTSIRSGPLRRDGSNSGRDDVVQVRQRPVVHLERAEPEAGRLAEPLEPLPERPQHAEHGDEERGLGRRRADARRALAGQPVRRYRRSRHGVVLTTRGRPPLDSRRAPRSRQNRRRAARAAGADRRRERRAAGRLDGHVGAGAGVAGARSSRACRSSTSFDEAGNQWWTLRGDVGARARPRRALDSVPNGGWLDGASTSSPRSEVLRRIAEEGDAAASPSGSSAGPTRRARASAARSSAPRPRPARWPTRTSCAS